MDTSAWVEFDRATGSAVDRRLTELISADAPVAVTEPVVAEVLAGAVSDEREEQLRRMLDAFVLLTVETATDFDGAVKVYRRCRSVGVTPRGLLDCLVAAVAIRTGASLLARDRDITQIAGVMDLRLDQASSD